MENFIEQILSEKSFINGIYVPWFDSKWFGFDIGKSIYDNYQKCFFDERYIKSVFTNCKVIGFDMVKIWLNESFEGMLFDENGSVVGVEPIFISNLEKLLVIIKDLDLKISLCVNAHQEVYFPRDKSLYDKYMRFVYVPEETEKYITNWLNPILQLALKYGCVPLIDVYAEPEADGGGWKVSRGFSWKTMVRFINRIHDAVKAVSPMFATTTSSGAACSTLINGKYSNVNVDYLGADMYTDSGEFPGTSQLLLSKRFMLGEFGLSNYRTATDDDQIRVVKRYIDNCLKTNVAGAFYWCYGWKCKSAGEMHLVNSEGELRPVASYYHFFQIDRGIVAKDEKGNDRPALLSVLSPHALRWFGSRGAEFYRVIRILNDKSEEIAIIKNNGKTAEYPEILKYDDEQGTYECKYRIVSVMPNGDEVYSDTVEVI